MSIPFLTFSWAGVLAALGFGYVLGSIPFGLLFAYAFGQGDVRKIGSGSIGATNVLRTGNYTAAALTLFFDAAKGAAAVTFMRAIIGDDAALISGLGAFLGHLYPVWLKFKGGKGIAVSLGILLTVYWPVALISLAIWLVIAGWSRISSLSALVAAVATPLLMLLFGRWHEALLALLLAALVFISHRQNIRRLLRGEEPRIGVKSTTA
jgi:glycerol-3-phosphate acyltransferase PlsY